MTIHSRSTINEYTSGIFSFTDNHCADPACPSHYGWIAHVLSTSRPAFPQRRDELIGQRSFARDATSAGRST